MPLPTLIIALTVHELAVDLTLGFIMPLLFINLAIGIVSRVAPQFSVFAVGFPITIGEGLTMLSFSTPLMDGAVEIAMDLLQSALPG